MNLRHLFMVACLSVLGLFAISSPLVAVPNSITFTVDSPLDGVDNNLADNLCQSTGPLHQICTLRAAIQQANATSGADTIVVPAGTYTLTIAGTSEDAAATGDLDVNGNTTILGAGASQTFINANSLDRVFEISPTARVVISGVTIQTGREQLGWGAAACPIMVSCS